MKCPHCGVPFHENWKWGQSQGLGGWHYRTVVCPTCKQITIELSPPLRRSETHQQWRQVHPIGSNRGPVPAEVPQQIATDYVEACQV